MVHVHVHVPGYFIFQSLILAITNFLLILLVQHVFLVIYFCCVQKSSFSHDYRRIQFHYWHRQSNRELETIMRLQ